MSETNGQFRELLKHIQVIPVITIATREQAIPMAQALANGGLDVLEVTLRTDCALDAIRDIKEALPDVTVGAGTVNTPALFEETHLAGADFAVSPGYTDSLIQAAEDIPLPYLPGVATPSEAMQLYDYGYKYLKMFPAEAIGAQELLKSIHAPLPELKFCPTGGVSFDIAQKYLALPNVICVGGSWLTPKDDVKSDNWDNIERLASETKDL